MFHQSVKDFLTGFLIPGQEMSIKVIFKPYPLPPPIRPVKAQPFPFGRGFLPVESGQDVTDTLNGDVLMFERTP